MVKSSNLTSVYISVSSHEYPEGGVGVGNIEVGSCYANMQLL